jgi:signal recognition particle receptor subunit beta
MVLFNYSTKELTAKIVYYGPGLCGKTTNLQYIFDNLPTNIHKGKMLSLATKTDRTLFFDFLPIDLGTIRGMRTRLQLYTVPGQVFYNTTRKLVLKGADGLVFVADSQKKMLDANIESYGNMEQNLTEHGMELASIPHVLQFNKRDLKDILSVEELNAALNKHNVPIYEGVATTGIGVQDILKAVTRLVLNSLRERYSDARKPASRPAAAAPAPSPAPPAPPRAPLEPAPVAETAAVVQSSEEPVLELAEGAAAAHSVEEPVLAVVEEEAPLEEEPVLEVEASAAEAIDEASPLSIDDVSEGDEIPRGRGTSSLPGRGSRGRGLDPGRALA